MIVRPLSVPDVETIRINRVVLTRIEPPFSDQYYQIEGCHDLRMWMDLKSRGMKGRDPLKVCVSSDDTKRGTLLHCSISYTNKLPSWDDIKSARSFFFPDDIDVMMVLPRKQDYVNLHKFTFHLWQTPTEWGIQ